MLDELELEIFRYEVYVPRAHHLKKADFLGASDPYITVSIDKITQKSDVVRQNLNPEWNAKFIFNVDAPSEVVFEVFDWDKVGSHDFLGSAHIVYADLAAEVRASGSFKRTLKLDGVSCGEIDVVITVRKFLVDRTERALKAAQRKNTELTKTVETLKRELERRPMPASGSNLASRLSGSLTIDDFKSNNSAALSRGRTTEEMLNKISSNLYREMYRFELAVTSGKDLVAGDFNGKSDPYCVVRFGDEVKKTEVVYETLEPRWKESSFTFTSEEHQTIEFKVYDWNQLVGHRLLGECTLDTEKLFTETRQHAGKTILSLDLKPKGQIDVDISYFKLETPGFTGC